TRRGPSDLDGDRRDALSSARTCQPEPIGWGPGGRGFKSRLPDQISIWPSEGPSAGPPLSFLAVAWAVSRIKSNGGRYETASRPACQVQFETTNFSRSRRAAAACCSNRSAAWLASSRSWMPESRYDWLALWWSVRAVWMRL